jgi:hypothetical protein
MNGATRLWHSSCSIIFCMPFMIVHQMPQRVAIHGWQHHHRREHVPMVRSTTEPIETPGSLCACPAHTAPLSTTLQTTFCDLLAAHDRDRRVAPARAGSTSHAAQQEDAMRCADHNPRVASHPTLSANGRVVDVVRRCGTQRSVEPAVWAVGKTRREEERARCLVVLGSLIGESRHA